jgi:hypothetical protein
LQLVYLFGYYISLVKHHFWDCFVTSVQRLFAHLSLVSSKVSIMSSHQVIPVVNLAEIGAAAAQSQKAAALSQA